MNEALNIPKIAIVVGAGGLRSLGAIELYGLLCEEEGIPIDLVVGCSGGSIVGMFGLGLTLHQIKSLVFDMIPKDFGKLISYTKLRDLFRIPCENFSFKKSIIEGPVWPQNLKKVDVKIENLAIPTLIQATDVITGKGVVFDKGWLSEVCAASCSFFPVFAPIKIDDRYYMDGSFSNPLPVIEAVSRNMDIIIAVTVTSPADEKHRSIFDAWWDFFRKVDIHQMRHEHRTLFSDFKGKIIYLDIELEDIVEIWDVDCLPIVFNSFKKELAKHKREIMNAIFKFQRRSLAA
jgi:NTE family protein